MFVLAKSYFDAMRPFIVSAVVALLMFSTDNAPLLAQTAPVPVIVGPLASGSSASFYYALEQGLFAKAGLDVKVQPMQSGSVAVAGAVGGAVNIGYANTLTVIQAHAKQIPVSLLAPGSLHQAQAEAPLAELLVSSDSTLRTPQDFVGKTIGVTSLNDLTVLAIKAWLAHGNVDVATVNFIEVPPASAIVALNTNRVAAITVYEPYLGAAIAQGAKVIAKPYDSISSTFLISAWFVSNQWASDHRDAALAFARVIHEVTPYVNAHYVELLPMVAQHTGVSVENLAKATQAIVPTSMRPAQVQPVIDSAVRFNAVTMPFKAQDIIWPGAP